ncbi:SH3 domain-containing protein [Jannaschia sp. KMU-145]|uniref:SH3 domain-containing protein n=1 Tax=Jannaschia halovivens TaxID=3388667 RepID=UPI00396AF9FD
MTMALLPRRATILGFALATALAAPAVAQEEGGFADAFSGIWFSFDPGTSTGGSCTVELAPEAAADGRRGVSTKDCRPPVSTATGWTIADGQIRLTNATDATVALLGGTQFRITGELGGNAGPLILERAEGDANSRRIREAITTYRCIFRGFTSTCATPESMARPAPGDEGPARIETLVNLNVRSQPRADAGVIGVVPTGSTVTVDTCLTTTDGLWCGARFGDATGWFARTAIRDDTWPILTFVAAE